MRPGSDRFPIGLYQRNGLRTIEIGRKGDLVLAPRSHGPLRNEVKLGHCIGPDAPRRPVVQARFKVDVGVGLEKPVTLSILIRQNILNGLPVRPAVADDLTRKRNRHHWAAWRYGGGIVLRHGRAGGEIGDN